MSVCPQPGGGKSVPTERPLWQVQIIEQVVDVLAHALDRGEATAASDLDGIEQRVQSILRRLGEVLTTRFAQQAVADCPRPCCRSCGRPMQRRNLRARHLRGTTGDHLVLVRQEYRCQHCGQEAVPAEEVWGLGPGEATPALQRVLARAGAEIASFARAADLVGSVLGIQLSEASAARTTEALGAVAEAQLQQQIAAAKAAAANLPQGADQDWQLTLLVAVDAAKVHGGGRWRDAKVAVAAPLGPESSLDNHGHLHLKVGEHEYCAGIEPADRFFERVAVLAGHAGWRPSPRVRVLLMGDGAPWIWERAHTLRAGGAEVVEVLDIYHAREHLWAVAHAFKRDDLAAHQWAERISEAMPAEGSAVVLKALAKLRPRTRHQREILDKTQAYFQANAARMDYPRCAAEGWPLGSGIVESACRLVCGLRCKQPGMRWSLAGARNVLSIRALALSASPRWERFWAGRPQLHRPHVAGLTRSSSDDAA